jgi:hypothetical protein
MDPAAKDLFCKALQRFGRCDVAAGGRSMSPFISDGDTVTVVVANRPVRYGEVAAFFAGDQLVLHRVVGRKRVPNGQWHIKVCGDSSPGSLGTVNLADVIGIVSHVNRHNRSHRIWFTYPFALLAIPLGNLLRAAIAIKKFRTPR